MQGNVLGRSWSGGILRYLRLYSSPRRIGTVLYQKKKMLKLSISLIKIRKNLITFKVLFDIGFSILFLISKGKNPN